MTSPRRKHHMDGLLVLLLFGVFAVCILSALLTGTDVYRRLADQDTVSYGHRTSAQYLATKVRQADRADGISVCDFEGLKALSLTEEIEGERYETRIYCYDGYLRELFSPVAAEMTPEAGEKVLEAMDFRAYMDEPVEHQLCVQIRAVDGNWDTVFLHLRSGEGAHHEK